jgi:hypothetical protein
MKLFSKICFSFLVLLILSCTGSLNKNKDLANRILADKSLDTVYYKASVLLKKGFTAGDGYPQVWIRDFNTFIEMSCDVYDNQIIRENLLTFLRLQQPDYEIVDGYVLKGHVTWDDPNIYISPADTTHVGFKNTVETDQETSLIQAIGKYISKTGDKSILGEKIAGLTVLERLSKSVDYLLRNRHSEKYGLLTGATTQDWGDVQVEGGAVVDIDEKTHWSVDIYDNAMFVIALRYMLGFSDNQKEKQKWEELLVRTEQNIRKYLWDDKHGKFIPHIYINDSPFPVDFKENEIWFHGGTAVAIEAGLLSDEEIMSSYNQMQANVKFSGAPSIGLTIYPPYPEGIIKDSNSSKPYIYQDGGDWTWFGGRMVQQLIAHGYTREAYEAVRPMIDRVISNNKFYEWYGRDGSPRGSGDFRGEAGVLGKVVIMLREWAEKNK